eukprot:604418_1
MGNSTGVDQREATQEFDVMQRDKETIDITTATKQNANRLRHVQSHANNRKAMHHRQMSPPNRYPATNINAWPSNQPMNRMTNNHGYNPPRQIQPQITNNNNFHMGSPRNYYGRSNHPPSTELVNQYGPIFNAICTPNTYHNPINTYHNPINNYYAAQPQGGTDTIVPPPPMAMTPTGELRPKRRKRKKRSRKKKTRRRHRERSPSSGKPKSPPPPPPPHRLLPPVSNTDSSADGGSSSSGTDLEETESKSQFIPRRPVSGVSENVLKGIQADKISSHLKLIQCKNTHKTANVIKFLKECLLKEVLFEGMNDSMINQIVRVMYRVDCPKGKCIVRQYEYGNAYLVIERGAFDIIHQTRKKAPHKRVGKLVSGHTFGEGNLLYSIPRAATAKATTASVVWALDATKYVQIRQQLSQQLNDKTSQIVRDLKKIQLFNRRYNQQDLLAIAHAFTERRYTKHARIVSQGDAADAFYVIKTGSAIAQIRTADGRQQTVRQYSDGDFFGERGIYKNESRAASIIATSTTRCYVMSADAFTTLLATTLRKYFEQAFKTYDEIAFNSGITRAFRNLISCSLDTLKANTLGILGTGAFGQVSLVKDPTTNRTYSLKKIGKNKVIQTKQEKHVRNERAVLATLDSAFCVQLFGTFQDQLNIYLLMEPVLGGEFFSVLRWNKRLSEKNARFYAACVVLAFEALHAKNIIYRDLKPENLLIAQNGYCKLVDFGFAKKKNSSCTLCGTPEYLAPEVIQHSAQGYALDWWTLGVFVYEMVEGHAPFEDDPHVNLYEKILTYEVEFPDEPKLTLRLQHFVLGLLEKDSSERLGATHGVSDLESHPWFEGLDWDKMRQQKLTPPYVPNITDREDLSNFDAYCDDKTDDDETLDPHPSVYEWCEDF